MGIAEVDREPHIDTQLRVLRHLRSLVPCERSTKLLRQGHDRGGDRVTDCCGAVPGQRGPVLDARFGAVSVHAWQVQQHREPAGALHKCPDRGTVESEDQIAFPVPRHRSIVGIGGSLADHDLRSHELLSSTRSARSGHT